MQRFTAEPGLFYAARLSWMECLSKTAFREIRCATSKTPSPRGPPGPPAEGIYGACLRRVELSARAHAQGKVRASNRADTQRARCRHLGISKVNIP
jgi:hypothetical protein